MSTKDYVKDILTAIHSVQKRAKDSINVGSFTETASLMADLHALELCLVIETDKLVEELENAQVLEELRRMAA